MDKSKYTEHLQAALQEAANSGDVEAAAAIAGWMKKSNKAEADVEAAAMPEATPPEAVPAEPDAAPSVSPLFDSVADQIEQVYPGAGFVSEDDSSVTIGVNDEEGETAYWRIPVTVAEDGTPTIGVAEPVDSPDDEAEAPEMEDEAVSVAATLSNQVKGHKRALLSPMNPKVLEAATGNQVWVNIVNLGEYEHDQYGTFEFTKNDFESWQKNLELGVFGGKDESGKNVIATDYGHSMDAEGLPPEQQKASGYIKELKLVNDSKVYALVEFTPPAIEGIKNKEWSWFSVSVYDGLTNQKTGEDTGSVLAGGALTNRPFIPDLEPIRLSDLRPSATMRLKREVEAKDAEIKKLQRESFNKSLESRLTALRAARIPPAVIALMQPVLEADFEGTQLIKLSRGGKTTEVKLGAAAEAALLELARVGTIPAGDLTNLENTKPVDETVDMTAAIKLVQDDLAKQGKLTKTTRKSDIYRQVYERFPHLKPAAK